MNIISDFWWAENYLIMRYRISTKELHWLDKSYCEKEFFSTEIHQYVINVLSKRQLTLHVKTFKKFLGSKRHGKRKSWHQSVGTNITVSKHPVTCP